MMNDLKHALGVRFVSSLIIVTFLTSVVIPPNACAQAVFNLPQPGQMVGLSSGFSPVVLKGVSIHPEDPLLFDFIVDHGQAGLKGQALTDETTKLVKYFLAGLAVPEKELWVNLSPVEKDRIMADNLSHTDVGRELLAQDYILKQITSTLMYPEKDLGRKFWDEVYSRTYAKFGNTNVPVDSLNKVWIMPDEATVYQNGNNAFVAGEHLKVMLESDYEAAKGMAMVQDNSSTMAIAKDVVRSVILPVLEKEVNEGKNFAALRQVFQSLILAGWYKKALKESLLGQVYANTNKVEGITIAEKDAREKVYARYLEAYQKGVYNYIKEEFDRNTMETTPRKYFSGGITDLATAPKVTHDKSEASKINVDNAEKLTYRMQVDSAAVTDVTKGVLPRVDPTTTSIWQILKAIAGRKLSLRGLFSANPGRAEQLTFSLGKDIEVDLSKNLIDEDALTGLLTLAKDVSLESAIKQMFNGEKINETENRAVLHVALRNVKRDETGKLIAANGPIFMDGQDVMPEVIAVLEKMEGFTNKVYSGEWRGYSGKRIKNIVNIGIGGSDLGPKMAVEALTPYKADGLDAYFVSNIDGTAAAELMKKLDPEETLVVVVSKTFTTQETMQNAQTFKDWVLKAYKGDVESIKKHFVASSTAKKLVTEFGIDPTNMFEFWDWVGGRYSVWSAVGLTLAAVIGFDNFLEFLQGAREADDHFRTQPFAKNIPVLKALLNVWYGNFLGAQSFAILPYDQYLNLFPAFAQQFFMESLGKSVDRNGKFVNYRTGLSVFGAAGTDGQHSFYQLFHQGTDIVPADFIGVINSHNPLPGHHDKFYSNFVAQTEALAFGVTMEEAKDRLKSKYSGPDLDWHAANQTFAGNKPTTSILIDKVTPRTLGSLVAMYEHQIFTESVVLNIFAFDQWGVQEGKLVATQKVLPAMADLNKLVSLGLSPSGAAAIKRFVEKQADNKDRAEAVQIQKTVLEPIVMGDPTHRPVKFGTSGDRGLFEVDFTPNLKNRIVNGMALYAGGEYPGKTMYVGYDPRRDNKEAVKDAARILAAYGLKVRIIAAEATPVPVLAYLTRTDKNSAGFIAFTASHSPYTDGGIKYSPSHGGAAPADVTDKITAYANGTDDVLMAEDYFQAKAAGAIEEISPEQAVQMYVNEYIAPKLKSLGAWQSMVDYIKANPDFHLVLDPMQGAAVRYFKSLYGAIARDAGRDFFTVINDNNNDPMFTQVNKEPNPTKEKSRAGLVDKVNQGGGRWMGSSADADSDRFGNVDLNGDFMSANDMIALIAYFLNKEIGVKGRIGKTVATSNFVNAIARHLGLEIDEFAVGFKNVVSSVLEGREYVVGGEESSHVMVGPFQDSWDDGIVVGVMGLWILAKTGKSLTEYKKEIQKALDQKFLIETLTIRGADDSIKKPVLDIIARTREELASGKKNEELTVVQDLERITGEKVHDVITKDGVKLVLSSGWILLRPSGTEPAIKFYVEVASPFSVDDDQMKKQFDQLVRSGKELMFGNVDEEMTLDDGAAVDDDVEETIMSEVDNTDLRGGIDLGQGNYLKVIATDAVGMPTFDPAQIQQLQKDLRGIVPVPVGVPQPVNLRLLLGLAPEEGKQNLKLGRNETWPI